MIIVVDILSHADTCCNMAVVLSPMLWNGHVSSKFSWSSNLVSTLQSTNEVKELINPIYTTVIYWF